MDWANLIWLDVVAPAKILVLCKLLYNYLPIDLEVQMTGVVLYIMWYLCVNNVES